MRSEYEFHHTFESEVMADIKCTVGEIVLFHPERFHSKFEKKSYKQSITVRCYGCSRFVIILRMRAIAVSAFVDIVNVVTYAITGS